MNNPEPSYWHHPMADIEPIEDHSCSDGAEAIGHFFDTVIGDEFKRTDRGPHHDCLPLYRRFLAMLWVLDPDRYFEGRTEVQVADYLGIHKARFSSLVRDFSQRFGLRNRFMKREGAVDVYRARQERIWQERRQARPQSAQLYLNVAVQ